MIGFFSYFRDYIPNFAEIAKPLTDLTGRKSVKQNSLGHQGEPSLPDTKGQVV